MDAPDDEKAPLPSLWVIAKVAERCNLDCPYCYMYHSADDSWRSRPVFLSESMQHRLIDRLAEHVARYAGSTTLSVHGGEPLLMGVQRMGTFLGAVREQLPPDRLRISLQSNGTLLSPEWLTLFSDNDVSLCISADGPRDLQDVFRPYRGGGGSAAAVERALELCLAWSRSDLFAGVLAVANPTVNGASVVRHFFDLGVRQLDLLMPDGTHERRPVGLPTFSQGDLLRYYTEAFDEWIALGRADFSVRIFRIFIEGMMGRRPSLDAFGGDISGMAVIESDGTLQLDDVLRLCGTDIAATGLDVDRHSFADFIDYANTVLDVSTPAPCQSCRAFGSCGGGYLPHRWDGVDFDRPSVHCATLLGLYDHIHRYLRTVTPRSMWRVA